MTPYSQQHEQDLVEIACIKGVKIYGGEAIVLYGDAQPFDGEPGLRILPAEEERERQIIDDWKAPAKSQGFGLAYVIYTFIMGLAFGALLEAALR